MQTILKWNPRTSIHLAFTQADRKPGYILISSIHIISSYNLSLVAGRFVPRTRQTYSRGASGPLGIRGQDIPPIPSSHQEPHQTPTDIEPPSPITGPAPANFPTSTSK